MAKSIRTHEDPARDIPKAPGCYELAASGPGATQAREDWVLYVGRAGSARGNLRQRLGFHASGSDLKKRMDRFLRKGYWIWYRFYRTKTAGGAKRLETHLLNEGWSFRYRWNDQGVPPKLW